MTFQEAHKNGKNGLVARRGLSEEMLKIRLSNYFSDEEINNIILDVSYCDCWTDGHIVIVQINNVKNLQDINLFFDIGITIIVFNVLPVYSRLNK